MSDSSAKEVFNRRLPLYAYLEPLLTGRRVLELGCGSGAGASYLAARGALRVLAVDTDRGLVDRARARYREPNLELRALASLLDLEPLGELFDVVLVAEAEGLVRRPEAVATWKRALAEGGRLVLAAASADRQMGGDAGVGYYELADVLAPHFARVQMFGVTPFAGFGVVEFDGAEEGLRVDSRLVEEGAEPPSAYLAVAGDELAQGLGYALVQIPFSPIEARLGSVELADDRGAEGRLAAGERRLDEAERRARARLEEAEGRIAELRRKLDDASAQSESALRVARAQGEEIEELRGRLRRAAEDRSALDGEVGKLRRALADADESVMSLTRRTAEEMSAVAQRLAVGLRGERSGDAPAPREESERLRVALAEAEARASAAEQRLEEVATDGRERQLALDDVLERLRLAEDAVARERREVARAQGELRAAAASARALDQSQGALAARDERIARLEGDKQDLVWRLAELEEKLRESIARAVSADVGRERSDELTAVRGSRDRALQEFHKVAGAHVTEATTLRAQVAEQAALVAELEDAVTSAEARAQAATVEAATLRKNAKSLEDADRTRRTRLAELEGKLLRLEHERKTAGASGAPAGAGPADAGSGERRQQELARERDELRASLQPMMRAAAESEEALWKTKDQLAGSRERIAVLEASVAELGAALQARAGAAAAPAPRNGHDQAMVAMARELDAIESGLQEGLEALADVERALEGAPAAPAGGAAPPAHGDAAPGPETAEATLLHTTLGNYRRRAGRLRDELEGLRRRWESLSPAEISGYLEDLGEDLAELEK